MTTDQAAAVQVWAAVASATLAVVLAVLTAIYVLLTRRLAESSMAQASGFVHERLYNQNLSLLTELARYPELRPFFYEKVMVHPAIPAEVQNRIKLVAEMYAGFLELIALHLDALPDTVRGEWRQFIFDAYEISPAVQQCFIDHRSWYSEVLHRILTEVPEERKRGRKITPTIRPMRHDDIDALMDIQHDAYRVQYYEKREVLLNKLGLFPGGCWVCVVQNHVISYIFSHPSRLDSPPALDQEMANLPDLPDTYYIHDVATHSSARGLGAAKLLCEKAVAIARNGRFKQLALVAVQDSRDWWLQEQDFTRAEVTTSCRRSCNRTAKGPLTCVAIYPAETSVRPNQALQQTGAARSVSRTRSSPSGPGC